MESEKLNKNAQDVKVDVKVIDHDKSEYEKPNLKGDYRNMMILFVLYVLQGA